MPTGAAAIPANVPRYNTQPAMLTNGALDDFGSEFQEVLEQLFPLTDEQIEALRNRFHQHQRSANAPHTPTPRPTVSTQMVSLDPGSSPPVIRIANGYVSSVVFVDQTGSPWPILAYDVGDPSAFHIQWDGSSNTMMIQGAKPYATGNMAIRLRDLVTPVMLTIVADQPEVDYRIDLMMQMQGPFARQPIIGSAVPRASNPNLVRFLEGVPPVGARELRVQGGQATAWVNSGQMYLRTRMTLLSPSWSATASSPDGTHVYQLTPAPVLLASTDGQAVNLTIEGL